jgi:hypothetical protein
MTLTLEATDKVLMLGDTPVRVWRGKTQSGVPLTCLVARVTPEQWRAKPARETIDMQPVPGNACAFEPA